MPPHHNVDYFPDNFSLKDDAPGEQVKPADFAESPVGLEAGTDLTAEQSLIPDFAEMSLDIQRIRPIESIRLEPNLQSIDSLRSSISMPEDLDSSAPPLEPDSQKMSHDFNTNHDQCRKINGLITSLPCQRFVACTC